MSSFDDKTKIPLAWAAAIIISLAGAIGNGAVAHYRLESLEKQWEEYKGDRKEHEAGDKDKDLRLQRVEDRLTNNSETVSRIETKLDASEKEAADKR